MVNPFRERKWTKISATAFMILLVWLWTCGHLMAWNYKPHPDQSRNWGCHYIHQLPNAVLRMFVIPFPLGALLMIVGTGRYPLTTWPNVFCCFAHIFCGFCLWFMAVADELPGIETENDEYGLKQYSLYHSIPGTAAYCVLEFARDVAAVMCIADAIVITRFYRQWMRQNAAREIDDAQRMAKIVIESVENRKNGINLNDSTQRELALFQRRQWTQKAFYKLVFLLQIIAVLSLLHIVSILFTLHEYGFHNLMLTYFGLASTRNHPYALQAPFVRDMIYTFMYFYVGTFLPLAAAQWQ
ncbi:unnamed protein product [Amoebophrya sp. A25]|nr:unnamed protein product [Amoebophrya sp. A25]|eukprot:GSA25T00012484001.1